MCSTSRVFHMTGSTMRRTVLTRESCRQPPSNLYLGTHRCAQSIEPSLFGAVAYIVTTPCVRDPLLDLISCPESAENGESRRRQMVQHLSRMLIGTRQAPSFDSRLSQEECVLKVSLPVHVGQSQKVWRTEGLCRTYRKHVAGL